MTPTTVPAASRSGPPLLPALMAASVWTRPSRATRRPGRRVPQVDRPVEPGDDPRGDGVGELAERAPDGDDELADGQGSVAPDRGGRQPGRLGAEQDESVGLVRGDDAGRRLVLVGEEDRRRSCRTGPRWWCVRISPSAETTIPEPPAFAFRPPLVAAIVTTEGSAAAATAADRVGGVDIRDRHPEGGCRGRGGDGGAGRRAGRRGRAEEERGCRAARQCRRQDGRPRARGGSRRRAGHSGSHPGSDAGSLRASSVTPSGRRDAPSRPLLYAEFLKRA